MQNLWRLELTAMLGERVATVTPIVMELDPYNSTVVPEEIKALTTGTPLSITPVFIE